MKLFIYTCDSDWYGHDQLQSAQTIVVIAAGRAEADKLVGGHHLLALFECTEHDLLPGVKFDETHR